MAGNIASKSQNQAFLAQHERHRLNKPCNRTIDLRGKVAGECLAYQFGGKTHYLDDRGYLIAKQLLDRFKGKYTVGVYEALLKALKILSANNDNEAEKELEFILKRSRSEIQFIPFENQLHRKESRIIFATPVEIRVADMLYHGATMDITSSAISVSLKRVSTLEKGDKVLISFPDLSAVPEFTLLSELSYSLLAIEHDALRTRLVLIRDRNDNSDVTQQFDVWCQQHNAPEYLDLDDELFNLACRYYQHLYCHTLTSPQFWIDPANEHDPVKAFQLNQTSESLIEPLRGEGEYDLSLLPFNEILTEQTDLLLQVSSQQVHLARRDKPTQVAALFNHHLAQKSSYLYLLSVQKMNIDINDFRSEIAQIAEEDLDYANALEKRLNAIGITTSVTDLSSCCSMLEESPSENTLSNITPRQGKLNRPTEFNYNITREHPRYLIHTPIQMNMDNVTFESISTDVSISGLSLTLKGNIAATIGSRVTIDFVRWQQQTSSITLTKLAYHIRNVRFWNGETYIDLERDKISTKKSINAFFASTIESNKKKLAKDNYDTIIRQESEIFGSLLSQNIATIPFYLAMDDNNKRIIQATVSTNNALDNTFWRAFQNLVTLLSEHLNALPNNTTDSIQLGIYCTQDNDGRWQITTDHHFNATHEKSLFINRALASHQHYFFHCRLTPIKFTWFDQETELNHQLLKLRKHSPHKVKQIKSIMLSFFAIGELTDITDIICAHY
jgi:hypothetical protein